MAEVIISVDDSSRRRPRVTYVQLQTLWEFLNSHRDVAIGYNKSAQAREYSRRTWESITEALNSQGEGAVKNCKGWSNYWVDYKAKLKRRAAAVRLSLNRTGGGPLDVAPLNDIEKKFLSLLGTGYGAGMPNTQVPVPFLAMSQTSSAGDLEALFPSGSEPIDPHLPEQPPVVDVDPQSHAPQEASQPHAPQEVSQPLHSTSSIREPTTSRPVRQQRHRGDHISQEAARRTMIQISRSRLELETNNSQTLHKMLDALNKIAEKIDRAVGGPEARDEGAPDS